MMFLSGPVLLPNDFKESNYAKVLRAVLPKEDKHIHTQAEGFFLEAPKLSSFLLIW